MRYIIVIVFMIVFTTTSSSQTYEIGPTLLGANYIGDVGNTSFINPKTLGYGATFRWNRSNRHSFRFSLLYANIEGNDSESQEIRRRERGYKFENSIWEASLGLEYTFWEYNLHSGDPQFTPYLYTGINYFKTNHLLIESSEFKESGGNWNFSIPMAVGFKSSLTSKLTGAFEIGARYTFTDNMDGSNPSEKGNNVGYTSFGNPNTNDWYVFTGVIITYTFGRKPCFCSF